MSAGNCSVIRSIPRGFDSLRSIYTLRLFNAKILAGN